MNLCLKLTCILISSLCISSIVKAQNTPSNVTNTVEPRPLVFVDSVQIPLDSLSSVDPNTVAMVTIFKGPTAKEIPGSDNQDGIISIQTKAAARRKFISVFRATYAHFDSLYTREGSDSSFCYILNNAVKRVNYEGDFTMLDTTRLISLRILEKEELYRRYHVKGKKYGILIRANMPKTEPKKVQRKAP